jgi:L-alanine-DL-glutamate epimerase-like enolase superfamily enzyme
MLGFQGHEQLFIGQDPLLLERHHRILDNLQFHCGRCWPLDLALWDLAGKITGRPCWKLLGGLNDRVRAYASTGTRRSPHETAGAARALLDRGLRAMKIRLGSSDWREGVAAVAAVRAEVGDRLELMVDANQGWRMPWDTEPPWTLKEALEVARQLEPLGVYWLEEPLHRGDYDGLAALRQSTGLRIAGGEMARELHELRTLIQRGGLDVLQPDAALVGGITGLRHVGQMALAHGLVFSPHTWTNGMGLIANAHLAAGCTGTPFLEFPFDPPEWDVERRDFMLTGPLRVDDEGWIRLSDRPGMGYEVDEDKLRRLEVPS